ncbi:UPF0235 protein C15orf40 homolog [Agrilus planipennis]|uniref:UPF0235 protein C15orf40 homolog n=1 Tax=Agrilus planipennis TaxID=224129 RepID=A0A1W4X8D7_AGRPL|nr:UPF0235 protein C15orf40 homolog [Agrilus planipennis]
MRNSYNKLSNLHILRAGMSSSKKTKKDKLTTNHETSSCSAITLDKSKCVIIKVLAKPGAKQNAITEISEEGVGIQINAPPVDGEANTELIKYLSKVLGLRKSDLSLDRGSKSRQKIVKVDQNLLSVDDVFKLLNIEIKN